MTISHTLREENQRTDFMAKLGASSHVDLLLHETPDGLISLLRNDVDGILFLCD